MNSINIYEMGKIPNPLKWQILAFMKMEWPFIFSGTDLYTEESYPADQNPLHFVQTQEDHLISHGQLLEVDLHHEKQSYPVYGFGNFFTFPPYRGEGRGRVILQAVSSFIQRGDRKAAMLFCEPSMAEYYEAAGWRVLNVSVRRGTPEHYELQEGCPMVLGHIDLSVDEPIYISEGW